MRLPLRVEFRAGATRVCLCFQMPLRLFPDTSAGGGEGTGGPAAFGNIWGLCLSEVNPTPPLHAGSPKGDFITRLAGEGSLGGGGAVHNAGATMEFQGRRPPLA